VSFWLKKFFGHDGQERSVKIKTKNSPAATGAARREIAYKNGLWDARKSLFGRMGKIGVNFEKNCC